MRVLLYVVLTVLALGWLVPIGTAVYSSFRHFEADTQVNGVFSWPEHSPWTTTAMPGTSATSAATS